MTCPRIAAPWLLAAWLAALAVCGLGMLDRVAEWSAELATYTAVWLLTGAVAWFLVRDDYIAPQTAPSEPAVQRWTMFDAVLALLFGGLALTLCVVTAVQLGPLPPAYHDEYSYLFGAQSVLAGRWTWPSHPTHPELFDQYHVLNEGVMASRYYPGTATWLAAWLALGNPYWGQWAAGALAAAGAYAAGRELGGRRCGVLGALLFSLAMGPALFGNLLLAHHSALAGLMLFLWAFVRGQRTGGWPMYFLAGCGLSFAMLCRPATAASFAFPFGAWWLANAVTWVAFKPMSDASQKRSAVVQQGAALAVPLVAGWAVMFAYNHAVTGDWMKSPYQLYTDLYTPRHVFGLNNVVRGEQRLGPKVLDEYDRWAENLTPAVAWKNVVDRLLTSGLATLDLPLMTLTAMLLVPLLMGCDWRWRCVAAAVLSMHAFHWFYWYAGIMGWHYVFETAPLWCLLCGQMLDLLWRQWRSEGRAVLPVWCCGLLALAWGGMYCDLSDDWPARWRRSWLAIEHPRQQHAGFRRWASQAAIDGPALVLVDHSGLGSHLDFVINSPGLTGPLLIGRYRPGQTDVAQIVRDFPDRRVFLCRPARGELLAVE
jgi:hypothetical protein